MSEETKTIEAITPANRMAGTPEQKSLIPATQNGIQLTTMEDMYRFAKCVVLSGLAPRGMGKAETVLVAIQAGMEVGFGPMQALQNVVVINGRPKIYGDAGLALVRSRDVLEDYTEEVTGKLENETRMWTIVLKRKGQSPITRSFSVDEAKKAGLWRKEGPWTQFPDRMLRYRALSFALRDGFSDILMGLGVAEEDYNEPVKNITSEVSVSDPRALQFEAPISQEQQAETPQEAQQESQPDIVPDVASAPKPMNSAIELIKDLIEKSSPAKVKKAMLAVGIKTEEGESWEQGSMEQLKSLASLLKC